MNPEVKSGRPRLGLSRIRERLALIGGSMRLESQPRAGTALCTRSRLTNQDGSP
jgi:signal transduction histidine kinase